MRRSGVGKAAVRRAPVGAKGGWERLFQSSTAAPAASSSRPKPGPASEKKTEATKSKKTQKRPLEQLYLDLGQRTFGRTVECPVCGLAYCEGEPSDEAAHRAHHRKFAAAGVHVRGALAEARVVRDGVGDGDARIVAIHATDGPDAHRKLAEAKALMDTELGETPPFSTDLSWRAYLWIEGKGGRVGGWCVAEPIETAYCAVPPAENVPRSDEGAFRHDGVPVEAMVGVSHIWVDGSRRRAGVGKALLDAVRSHFATGWTVPRERLAFSQPTSLGRRLAASYSQTEAFLVYE